MKIRTLKIESKLIPIIEELRDKGYIVDNYTGLESLKKDGLRVMKQGFDNSKENMMESKWLCGIVLYRKEQDDLVLNLREETPYSEELFGIMKKYFEY